MRPCQRRKAAESSLRRPTLGFNNPLEFVNGAAHCFMEWSSPDEFRQRFLLAYNLGFRLRASLLRQQRSPQKRIVRVVTETRRERVCVTETRRERVYVRPTGLRSRPRVIVSRERLGILDGQNYRVRSGTWCPLARMRMGAVGRPPRLRGPTCGRQRKIG